VRTKLLHSRLARSCPSAAWLNNDYQNPCRNDSSVAKACSGSLMLFVRRNNSGDRAGRAYSSRLTKLNVGVSL
jgi:hypothetical protein